MRKPKKFAKGGKSPNSNSSGEDLASTADDVLASGVEFEEAGEKWRSGDTAKSCRFFVRALEAYEKGLQRFPASFDLAYNRARLFYELTQQTGHVRYMQSSGMTLLSLDGTIPTTTTKILEKALELHLYALKLDPENGDTILRSLAEAVDEDFEPTQRSRDNKLAHLKEAVDRFEKCFSIQRYLYRATHDASDTSSTPSTSMSQQPNQQTSSTPDSTMQVESEIDEATQDDPEERWASIEAPVTEATLLDTCLAQMEALAQIAPMVSTDQSCLESVETKIQSLVKKAEGYAKILNDEVTTVEFCRTRAKAACELLLVAFRANHLTADSCTQQIDAFLNYTGKETSADALSEAAEIRLAFNAWCMAPRAHAPPPSRLHLNRYALHWVPHQWSQLCGAMKDLTAATNMLRLPSPWLFYSRRADVELYRCRLAEYPWHHEPAMENKAVMLKNAEVYYRGAKKLAQSAGEGEFAEDMAERERVVQTRRGQEVDQEPSSETVQEMVTERLFAYV